MRLFQKVGLVKTFEFVNPESRESGKRGKSHMLTDSVNVTRCVLPSAEPEAAVGQQVYFCVFSLLI